MSENRRSLRFIWSLRLYSSFIASNPNHVATGGFWPTSANTSDTEATFLDLHLSVSNDIVSTKMYDKRDDFDFEVVNFPFLDGDVPHSTSYVVYDISQLTRFAKASGYVTDFNTRNKLLT